jgi:hypothetical protein
VAINQALVYDPRYHSFDSWASLLAEQYAAQQLGSPPPEMYWQDWAAGLNAIGLFNNEAVPDPYRFDNWQDWAAATLNSVNLPPTGNN